MKKFFAVLLVITMFLVLPLTTYAAEKEMNVTLSEGYTQANFYFSFESEQDYNVIIIDPNGDVKSSNVIKGTDGSISVSGIIPGNYQVKISASDDIAFSESPRVEMVKGDIQTEKKGINVSSVVSNLKVWFEDGKLFASWDNTNIGKVNIQIINPITMEMIANSSVDGTSYSTPIAKDIEMVNFFIVPSSSSKIKGAGETYSIKVVRNIPGEVYFPQETLFNKDIYSFEVNLYGNTTIRVCENGKEQYNNSFPEEGTYSIKIPLNDAENNIEVEVIDSKGNLNRYKTKILKDIVAPLFTINSINEITKEKSISILGKVTEVNEVYINGYPVEVSNNGQFSYEYELEVGDNKINITATDKAGNMVENNYIVTRTEVSYIPLYIAGVIVLIGCIGFSLWKRITQRRNEEKQSQLDIFSEDNSMCEDILKEVPVKTNKLRKENKDKKPPQKTEKEKNKVSSLSPVKNRELNILKGNILVITLFAIFLYIFLNKGIMVTRVMSSSMEPTLKVGDFVIYNRLAYLTKDVQRGDIVCFHFDESNETFSKRVIGIAGDTIQFKDGYLIINGEKVEEEYIDENIETNSAEEFVVPEGMVFLLGDNRNNSYDSRFWENPFTDIAKIHGKFIGYIKSIF